MRMFRLFTSGVYSLMYILSTSSGWGGRGFFCMLLIDLLYIEVKSLLMMMLIAFLIGYSVIIFYKCWGELYWKFSHVVSIETIIMLCVCSHEFSWRYYNYSFIMFGFDCLAYSFIWALYFGLIQCLLCIGSFDTLLLLLQKISFIFVRVGPILFLIIFF